MAWKIMACNGSTYYANKAKLSGETLVMKDVYRTDCYGYGYSYHATYILKGVNYSASEKKGVWKKNNEWCLPPELES